MRIRVALGTAFVLLTAACGSTVQMREQTGLQGTVSPGTLPGNAGLSGPGSGNVSLGAPGTTPALPAGVVTTAPGIPPPALPGAVPGITPTRIYIGAAYQTDQGAANSSIFGTDELDSGDARDYYKVVLDDINRRGGIFGRKLEAVYFRFVVASAESVDSQFQAACETWTKDSPHGVFAIMSGGRPSLQECARKAGVLQISEESASVAETFSRYPTYVEISDMNLVRQGFVTVDGLVAQDYFGDAPRIGIVAWDDENHRTAVDEGFVPALARYGLQPATETAYVHVPQAANDLGGTSADISAAVLRFNTEDIDRVFLLDGTAGICLGGCLTTLFMREAESQQYRPIYGLNQNNGPQAGIDAGLYPPEQMVGAKAVLWSDANADADAGIKQNPERKRCEALMRKHGIEASSGNAQGTAMAICSQIWFMGAAAARIAGRLTVASFMAGVNALGSSFRSPIAYANYFDANRHDGAAAARNASFVESCTCMRYTTTPYRV